ncbi:MAG: hypothetical protein CR967_01250 [Proteobacteria bacterium]|nr:MAG: hypothetical protein CR967_01250 [Pseudomonadota bacterium]
MKKILLNFKIVNKVAMWLRIRKWKRIIAESKMFDNEYYLFKNPDVKRANIDPLSHFLEFGSNEGRDPSEWFGVKKYLDSYPDVAQSGINPLAHYIMFGSQEKRLVELNSIYKSSYLNVYQDFVFNDLPILTAQKYVDPMVSIIIPAYNQAIFTYKAIESILQNANKISYEIIVIDDNSSEKDAIQIADKVRNIKYIRNNNNLGFLKNCNKAVSFAEGKYLVFLNNDVIVLPNWLSSLLDVLENNNDVGLVGSKLIFADGILQEAGGIIWNDASGKNFGRGDDPKKSEYNYLREVDYVSGASMAIRRDLFINIGGFDERFAPAYYEDSDLAFTVRSLGLKVVYQPLSEIIHFEGVSHGTNVELGIKKHQVINRELFKKKWQHVLHAHAKPNQKLFLAKDRSFGQKHILIISHNISVTNKDPDNSLIYCLQFCQALDYVITLVPVDSIKNEKDVKPLQQKGIFVFYEDNGFSLLNHLKTFGHHYDFAYFTYPEIQCKFIKSVQAYTKAKILQIK